jgi:pyridoxine kinase
MKYYEHERIEKGCHGTGDVFASTFLGSYLNNSDLYEASKIAADFVVKCIKNTIQDKDHWYGVKFEPLLKDLVK